MSKYVIACLRHNDLYFGGDVFLFWGTDHNGYTAVLQTAGLYSLEEAMQIFGEDDVPIDIDELELDEALFGAEKISDLRFLILMGKSKDNKKLINESREKFRKLIEQTA